MTPTPTIFKGWGSGEEEKFKESWMSGGEVVLRGWEDKEDGGDGVLVEEEEKLIKEELEEKGHLEVEEEERRWHYIPIKEISHLADCRQHTKPRSTIQSYNATSPVQHTMLNMYNTPCSMIPWYITWKNDAPKLSSCCGIRNQTCCAS